MQKKIFFYQHTYTIFFQTITGTYNTFFLAWSSTCHYCERPQGPDLRPLGYHAYQGRPSHATWQESGPEKQNVESSLLNLFSNQSKLTESVGEISALDRMTIMSQNQCLTAGAIKSFVQQSVKLTLVTAKLLCPICCPNSNKYTNNQFAQKHKNIPIFIGNNIVTWLLFLFFWGGGVLKDICW